MRQGPSHKPEHHPTNRARQNGNRMPKKQPNTINQLQHLMELAPKLPKMADDWAEGYGTKSPGQIENPGGSTSPKNEHKTPTERLALGHTEGAGLANDCLKLHRTIRYITRLIGQAAQVAEHLEPIAADIAYDATRTKQPRNWSAGECAVDDEWVNGEDDNRLKLGLCPHHYNQFDYARRLNRNIDRHAWIAQQRHAASTSEGESEGAA